MNKQTIRSGLRRHSCSSANRLKLCIDARQRRKHEHVRYTRRAVLHQSDTQKLLSGGRVRMSRQRIVNCAQDT